MSEEDAAVVGTHIPQMTEIEADVYSSRIRKMTEDEAVWQAADGGTVTIGALTALIFGEREARTDDLYDGLTRRGREMLQTLQPLRINCIQEIE
ncbi:MAG: hypothetical protein LUF92_00775 [Clostridiales bacterium]|nr:hypothetical protein [Clostridiales bacterium]